MAEVTGCLVVRVGDDIKSLLLDVEECINEELLEEWFDIAGLALDQLDDELELDELDLYVESIEEHGEYLVIHVFGEAWEYVLDLLVTEEAGELWARLWHECGVESYYALTDGNPITASINLEDDDGEEKNDTAKAAWQKLMPNSVVRFFE